MTENQDYGLLLEGTYLFALHCYEVEDWSEAVKWFSVVVEEKNPNYKEAADFLNKATDKLKQIEYKVGKQALHNREWSRAHNHLEKVHNLDSNYQDVALLLERVRKGLKLPELYNSARQQLREEKLDVAISTLEEIIRVDKNFRDANFQLNWALRRKRVVQQYAEAMELYERARQKNGEMDWRRAVTLLKKVNRAEPGYKGVNRQLGSAQNHLKLIIHYNKGSRHLDHQQWLRAKWHLNKAHRIDSTYRGVGEKLEQARQMWRNQWRKGPFGIAWKRVGAILGVILTIAFAIFANQFARVGDIITVEVMPEPPTIEPTTESTTEPTVEPTTEPTTEPTVEAKATALAAGTATAVDTATETVAVTATAIPGVDKIEVSLDGNPLDLRRLPDLKKGQEVKIEVVVLDTNGKEYTSDDLVCTWSVEPLGDEDREIETDLCKTLYRPSQEYSSQTVIIEVEGLEQQFEPGNLIEMEFDIVDEPEVSL